MPNTVDRYDGSEMLRLNNTKSKISVLGFSETGEINKISGFNQGTCFLT